MRPRSATAKYKEVSSLRPQLFAGALSKGMEPLPTLGRSWISSLSSTACRLNRDVVERIQSSSDGGMAAERSTASQRRSRLVSRNPLGG